MAISRILNSPGASPEGGVVEAARASGAAESAGAGAAEAAVAAAALVNLGAPSSPHEARPAASPAQASAFTAARPRLGGAAARAVRRVGASLGGERLVLPAPLPTIRHIGGERRRNCSEHTARGWAQLNEPEVEKENLVAVKEEPASDIPALTASAAALNEVGGWTGLKAAEIAAEGESARLMAAETAQILCYLQRVSSDSAVAWQPANRRLSDAAGAEAAAASVDDLKSGMALAVGAGRHCCLDGGTAVQLATAVHKVTIPNLVGVLSSGQRRVGVRPEGISELSRGLCGCSLWGKGVWGWRAGTA
jgi:hypothetical protein